MTIKSINQNIPSLTNVKCHEILGNLRQTSLNQRKEVTWLCSGDKGSRQNQFIRLNKEPTKVMNGKLKEDEFL